LTENKFFLWREAAFFPFSRAKGENHMNIFFGNIEGTRLFATANGNW